MQFFPWTCGEEIPLTTVRSIRPPLDPELAAALSLVQPDGHTSVTPELIAAFREAAGGASVSLASLESDGAVVVEHREATSLDGTSIPLLILRPKAVAGAAVPCIYHVHGGGMIMGNSRTGIEVPLSWALAFGAVVVSVEYRLAPEFPDPVPVEDSYAGLAWAYEHADSIGVDREPS